MQFARAFTICAVAFSFAGISISAAALPPNLTMLIGAADSVYSEASEIVEDTPTSSRAADALAAPGHIGFTFHRDEKDLKDKVSSLAPTYELQSQKAQVAVRLSQFDNFVFDAVTDSLSCNRAGAKANLRVSLELLQELHRVSKGRGDPEWMPPSMDAASNVSDSAQCS